jgi:hypothetical protein
MESFEYFTIKSLVCEDNWEGKGAPSSTMKNKNFTERYGEKDLVIGEKFITIS